MKAWLLLSCHVRQLDSFIIRLCYFIAAWNIILLIWGPQFTVVFIHRAVQPSPWLTIPQHSNWVFAKNKLDKYTSGDGKSSHKAWQEEDDYGMDLSQTSLVAQMVKCLPTMWETRVQSLGWEDLLEKEMAIHSSILAWKFPWMEEPGGLQSMGSQSCTWLSDFTFHLSQRLERQDLDLRELGDGN